MPPTVVFDTNILVSALLSLQGSPFRCLALARLGMVHSATCSEILDEFSGVLVNKLGFEHSRAQVAVAEVRACSRLVAISRTLAVIAEDPADNKVLECAVVAGAQFVVSGDRRHLLPLGSYQGIAIISATQLLAQMASQ